MKFIGPDAVDVTMTVADGQVVLKGGKAILLLADGTRTEDIPQEYVSDQLYGFGFYQEPAKSIAPKVSAVNAG